MQVDWIQTAVPTLQKILNKIKPLTSTAMKSTVVSLYTADPQGRLRYSNLIGLLQLDVDRLSKSKFLRIYDLQTLSLQFQVQIYYGFQKSYRAITDTIYIFDYPKGSIAFQFRNAMEAEIMKAKIFSNSPSLEEYEIIKQKNIQAAKKKQEENGFFGKIKNFFSGQKQIQQQHESEILSFKKNTSISFNLNNGSFDTQNVPPQWQQVFSSLKLTKEEMQDKDIMGVIVQETILTQVKRQAQQQQNQQLQNKIKNVELENKKVQQQFQQDIKRSTMLNLPPPPPPPPALLAPANIRNSIASKRTNLMDQIRNNNIKLKHVDVNKQGQAKVNIDISNMNKQQRNDHIENLRLKLQMRKKALNRRQEEDD